MAKKAQAARGVAISDMGKPRPGTLEMVFKRDVNIKSIQEATIAAFRWHGCIACGLNGLDLRFRAQDPIFEVFNDIEGLTDINVYR